MHYYKEFWLFSSFKQISQKMGLLKSLYFTVNDFIRLLKPVYIFVLQCCHQNVYNFIKSLLPFVHTFQFYVPCQSMMCFFTTLLFHLLIFVICYLIVLYSTSLVLQDHHQIYHVHIASFLMHRTTVYCCRFPILEGHPVTFL